MTKQIGLTKQIRIPAGANKFSEEKDEVRKVRVNASLPALDARYHVVLDFSRVPFVTQSFMHAVIGDALKRHGEHVLDRIEFHKCNSQVRSIVSLVVDYSFGGFEPYSKVVRRSLRRKIQD